jgi:hypothetical protein
MSMYTGPEGMNTSRNQQRAMGASQDAEKLREQTRLEHEVKAAHEGDPKHPWWRFWKR